MNDMKSLADLLIEAGPLWAFFLAVLYFGSRSFNRLFNEDKGVVPRMIAAHLSLVDSLKTHVAEINRKQDRTVEALESNNSRLEKLCGHLEKLKPPI